MSNENWKFGLPILALLTHATENLTTLNWRLN